MRARGGGSATTSSTTTTTDPGPPITAIATDFVGGWSPAWIPRPDDELVAALDAAGLWLPVPVDAPDDATARLDIEVAVYRRVPVGPPGADLIVRNPDGTVFVSIQTLPIEGNPICSPPLDDTLYPAWASTPIRGTDGCAWLSTGGVSMIEWTEAGQDFHAEFTTAVALDDIVQWLDRWEQIGA